MAYSDETIFRVFETRESEEYKKVLSEVLSLESSPSAAYPDLITTSYEPSPKDLRALVGDKYASTIKRIINIDYVGMAATVLLDKHKNSSHNGHYHRLRDLSLKLDELNESGIALKLRILLQYPYSLAGQNRILAEEWNERTFMTEVSGSLRDENQLAPNLTDDVIQHSELVRIQMNCLQNFQDLLDTIGTNLENSPNSITLRFASISTLLCCLRVNNLFFYDPYHYGRQKGERTCAITSTPVIMIDGSKNRMVYDVFCNHFQYIWECDSTLDYSDVTYRRKQLGKVYITTPSKIRNAHKIERLKRLSFQDIDWEKRDLRLRQVVNNICPMVGPIDAPEIGFLAAAWRPNNEGGGSDICQPAKILEEIFNDDFRDLHNVRVAVLRGQLGSTLSDSLFNLMNASTFSIIVLTKELADKYCRPNVYIELGYLLHKNKADRTFIVAEEGVQLDADIQNFVHTRFNSTSSSLHEDIQRIYKELLQAMKNAGIISTPTLMTLMEKPNS